MSLSKSRTIASLTTKKDILKLPGFEDLENCTAKELKEYVKKRVVVYAKNAKMNTRGFTVGDYMENYKKDPKPYKPFRNKAIDNLKDDITQIANNARKAKDDLKEFEADKTNEREQAKQDRQLEAAAQERRKREQEEFREKLQQSNIMEEREELRKIIERYGKNSNEYNKRLNFIRGMFGEDFLEKVLNE